MMVLVRWNDIDSESVYWWCLGLGWVGVCSYGWGKVGVCWVVLLKCSLWFRYWWFVCMCGRSEMI